MGGCLILFLEDTWRNLAQNSYFYGNIVLPAELLLVLSLSLSLFTYGVDVHGQYDHYKHY